MIDNIKFFFVEFGQLAAEAWRHLRRRWIAYAVILGAVCMASLAVLPWDADIYHHYLDERNLNLIHWAGRLRHWGRFNDSMIIFAALFLLGLVFKRRYWRTAAKAFFLAAIVGGLTVNIFRFSTGRPRPHVVQKQIVEKDGFYGPTFEYERQSFPSGHACTSYAGAAALAVAHPGFGLIAVVSASGVAWSSFYSQNHWPTDLIVGSGLGILIGIPFGLAARRRKE